MLSFAVENLKDRVDCKPQPAGNWSRAVPVVPKNTKIRKLLEAFLLSPVDQVFDFRRNQEERTEIEAAILGCGLDLRFETIKKGSPHTLRIFKTQAAYEKQMKECLEDAILSKWIK